MTEFRIRVERRHIDHGVCKSPQQCAIAAAIRDMRPEASYVAVRTNGITVTSRGHNGDGSIRRHYAVPKKAARAIIAFDEGKDVAPFTFSAKLIDEIPLVVLSYAERRKNKLNQRKKLAKLLALGISPPKYGPASRVAGV